jgi:hypothetical protein
VTNAGVRGFVADVWRAFTWRHLLLMQLLLVAIDVIALLSFVLPFRPSVALIVPSRFVIEETMAVSIVMAVLVADQAIARGVRRFRAYAVAILIASILAGVTQYEIRSWLGLYTRADQPGRDITQRRMQMVYVFSDTLTYGVLLILVYVDYQNRERVLRHVRAAEFERARKEQRLVASRLAALRSEVDAAALLQSLAEVKQSFEQESPGAAARLDALIASLRAQLTPVAADGAVRTP